MDIPETTLFMLMSLDGKISTGSVDERDVDVDFPKIDGVKEGLHQYYDIEQTTDWYSFNTGRVMAKVGWNDEKSEVEQIPVVFVIVDNKPHLTARGVENLTRRTEKLYIVTTNEAHPALGIDNKKLEVIAYDRSVDFAELFARLKEKGAKTMTIQSGGEMNAVLLRAGLINKVSIVIAPVLVGGRDTSTLVDGDSLQTVDDLRKLRALELAKAETLKNSYVHLTYKVIN